MRHLCIALAVLALPTPLLAQPGTRPAAPIVGMYVHQHWPYKHPYAARTWTLEDWDGYTAGLAALGYNTIVIWPVLETTPEPPTPSDLENIHKIAKVIDLLHGRGMRCYLTISPNVIADDPVAIQSSFQERHFFDCDLRVNPAEQAAVKRMMDRRKKLFAPLTAADGVLIIDSDPGGYPRSTNAEFVSLLAEHRRMFDELRPGIELVYWVWAGWPSYGRLYETGTFAWGTPAEFEECLTLLRDAQLEPWGLALGLEPARKLGLQAKVMNLQYGAIEGEPSWPLTNYGGDAAWKAGNSPGPRGVVGNSQTHCVQLPNTFAFARGAAGKPVTEADYVAFADQLITGRGRRIVEAWTAMHSGDADRMEQAAASLESLAAGRESEVPLRAGPLKGLLFNDPKRFINDLVLQLRFSAATAHLIVSANQGADLRKPATRYLAALEAWYAAHGYQNFWAAAGEPLRKLNNARLNDVLGPTLHSATPMGRVHENLWIYERFTPRLIAALRAATQPVSN